MRLLLVGLLLTTGACATIPRQASTAFVPDGADKSYRVALGDASLDFISATPRRPLNPTVNAKYFGTRDPALREFNIVSSVSLQQMDSWWAGPGASLIFAGGNGR